MRTPGCQGQGGPYHRPRVRCHHVTETSSCRDRATFSAMTTVLLLFIASSALGFRFGARR
jgi:hypothetical protein